MAKQETFEQRCIAINNRYERAYMGNKAKMKFFTKVFDAGPITRMYRRRKWLGQKECPQCHAKWKAKEVQEHKHYREIGYHMVLEAKGDIQVCRFFMVERKTNFGKSIFRYVWEVERIMYAPTGERRVFAKGVQGMSQYFDAFSMWGEMKLRHESRVMSWSAEQRYNLDIWSYTIKSLSQQWQYKNIPEMLDAYKCDTSVLRVIAYPWAETMLKTGQKRLFDYFVKKHSLMPKGTAHALNICTRNHYDISDPSLWIDTVYFLKYLRMDTHNPHYVCPDDLRALHQTLFKRYRREEDRREALRAAKRAEKEEQARIARDKAYAEMVENWPKHMGQILTLSLSGENLNVRPLQSIDEFKQEGTAMHHCVYSMKYYDYNRHPNCLILSAKDSEGNRLATIEYNTKSLDIVQCRAACNAVPERDAEIRELITSHKADFKRLLKAA